MRRRIASLCALVGAAAVVWFFWVQHQDIVRLQTVNQDLRQRSSQSEALRQENQRLVKQLKTEAERPQAEHQELLRLRGQKGVLQGAARENKNKPRRLIELVRLSALGLRRHIKIHGAANPHDPQYADYFRRRRQWGTSRPAAA